MAVSPSGPWRPHSSHAHPLPEPSPNVPHQPGKALAPGNLLVSCFSVLTPTLQASSQPVRSPRHPTLMLPAQPDSFTFTHAFISAAGLFCLHQLKLSHYSKTLLWFPVSASLLLTPAHYGRELHAAFCGVT